MAISQRGCAAQALLMPLMRPRGLFIYRDEVYNRETEEHGIAEVIIGKQRSGPTGVVKVRFFREHTRFDDLADAEGYDE